MEQKNVVLCTCISALAHAPSHKILSPFFYTQGLVTFIFAIVPPILGQMTAMLWRGDITKTSLFPTRFHQVSGYIAIALSWATLFVGMHKYGVDMVFYVLLALWMCLLIVVFALMSLPAMRNRMTLKILDP